VEVIGMLFLILQRLKPGMVFTPEMFDAFLASQEYLKGLKEKGVIKHSWAFAAGGGGCGIVDVPSHEDLYRMLAASPASGLVNFEAIPLASMDVVPEMMLKAKERLAK